MLAAGVVPTLDDHYRSAWPFDDPLHASSWPANTTTPHANMTTSRANTTT
jgi:hypothetical protein